MTVTVWGNFLRPGWNGTTNSATLPVLRLHRSQTRGEFARRITASSDIFQGTHRAPLCSVNFLTAHDGFTLEDLVITTSATTRPTVRRTATRHSHNLSINCGQEGTTENPAVLLERKRLKRALLATLLLARGTPMLLAGDEIGRSQDGNNNAYCQDNEISWVDWSKPDAELTEFVANLIRLRGIHGALPNFVGQARWWQRTQLRHGLVRCYRCDHERGTMEFSA